MVAIPPELVLLIEPVGVNLPVAGSYNSADVRSVGVPLVAFAPPAIRTWPSPRSVAVWDSRGTVIVPAEVNLSVFGSYSSADAVAGVWSPE